MIGSPPQQVHLPTRVLEDGHCAERCSPSDLSISYEEHGDFSRSLSTEQLIVAMRPSGKGDAWPRSHAPLVHDLKTEAGHCHQIVVSSDVMEEEPVRYRLDDASVRRDRLEIHVVRLAILASDPATRVPQEGHIGPAS